jgi:uncharacterized membrane-anchored protein YitT (DUF2179 family)
MTKKQDCNEKDVIINGLLFVFGTFCSAICYNLFFLPNNIVVGGVSGLGIVVQQLTGLNSTVFIYVANILLVIACYYTLGKEETHNTLIGSILYPVMISITVPITSYILNNIHMEEFFVIALMAGLLNGFSSGLVYRCGFSLGGSDVLVRMISHYFHIPEGKATFGLSFLIILSGGAVFGVIKVIYALIILYITSIIIDKVMFGLSDSKVFYVFTKKSHLVKRTILREFQSGFTVLPTKGGYSHQNGMLIMCVLPNREYYRFKKRILELDPKAFFVIADCYESHGGFVKKNLPFI